MQHAKRKSVRKLTTQLRQRHGFGTFCRYGVRSACAVICFSQLFAPAYPESVSAWQAAEEITAAAEAYLRQRTGKSAHRTTVRAGALDPRHRLPRCDQTLEPFMRRGAKIGARTIIGVRCSGSKPWKVYVPVDVVVTVPVYTASRTLPRGHLLTAADLVVDERDVSRLVSGYITNSAGLVGQRLKFPLIAGRIITPAMLSADHIVRRGQTVTLIASGSGIRISMTGKALMDGAKNQRIRVENVNSGRIIEGIVRSREHVEVLAPSTASFFNAKPKVSP